ncbi:MAG: hypothetical protein KDH09_04485 [Chrysiogenetes bacterium]|nr:hypothetical protein [Chrysiogenetes bacterium]
MNFFTHILNGKKTIVGLIGFVGCKVLARALPEAGEACEMLADYVFAPLAGLGAWHKLAKIEGTSPRPSAPPRGNSGNGTAPPPASAASFERFGARRAPHALIVAALLAGTTLTGCASLQGQGLARGITEAARDALEGAAEEANIRKHLRDFFEDVGELLFGEEEIEAGQ